MIPKKIHMFWFGRGVKSDIIKKCIESWQQYAPNYEIVEWNEDNFDVNFCERSKQAYAQKKWAFVADVARLKVIYEQGGIYLDTDVELLKPLDELMGEFQEANTFFLFMHERFINTGLGFGAVAGSAIIKHLLDNYMGMPFELKRGLWSRVCTEIETDAIEEYYPNFIRNNRLQRFEDGTVILSTGVWEKYSYHYGTGTWVDGGREYGLTVKNRNYKIREVIRTPMIFKFIRKYFGSKAEYVYQFITYDLIDIGPAYYVKRLIKKIFAKK